jgi:hypothetical protein
MTKATQQTTQENIYTLNLSANDWQIVFGLFMDKEEQLKKNLVEYVQLDMDASIKRHQQEWLELQVLFSKLQDQAYESKRANA